MRHLWGHLRCPACVTNNILTISTQPSNILVTGRGGGFVQNFGGASKFGVGRGEGVSKFWGDLQIFGGVSKFAGGVPPNFRGGGFQIFGASLILGGLQIFGGSTKFFFLFFSISFPPKKSFWVHQPPPPRDGQCAAGTHPTGMHCCTFSVKEKRLR